MWRLIRKCLPTRTCLRGRGIDCPTICVCCNGALEDSWHLFLMCPSSKECWEKAKIWTLMQNFLHAAESFGEFFSMMCKLLDEDKLALFIMVLWSLWCKRNLKCWENVDESAGQVLARAVDVLSYWRIARRAVQRGASPDQVLISWQPPPHGFMKCNIDAAIFDTSNHVGMGACMHDEIGQFVTAFTDRFFSSLSAAEAEG